MNYSKIKKVSLKIHCDNTDNFNSETLWEYILDRAKESNISGATVYKAVAGIGNNKNMHRFDLLNLSNTMPLVIEIVETKEKIENFLNILEFDIKDVFITMQDTEVLVSKDKNR